MAHVSSTNLFRCHHNELKSEKSTIQKSRILKMISSKIEIVFFDFLDEFVLFLQTMFLVNILYNKCPKNLIMRLDDYNQ